MPIAIASLVPNVDDLLDLEAEEIAGVLLAHLNSFGQSSGDGVVSRGQVNQPALFNRLSQHPEYERRNGEVFEALLEGWSWLDSAGLLMRDPHQTAGWYYFSRAAKKLKSRDDFKEYRNANLLPKRQLHPMIAMKVYPTFLRGEYDTAVFQAFREVEVAVRETGHFSQDDYGTDLMRAAFRPQNRPDKPASQPGPLTDTALPVAEQEAMAHLFAGAIGLYKNPQSHRNVPTAAADAAEIIMFASHLLRIVDRFRTDADIASGLTSRSQ